jgi:hypothetical protein
MKTTLKFSLIISFIANVDSIVSLFGKIFKHLNIMDLGWIFHIISIVGVFIAVYYLLSRHETIKNEMIANNIVGELRNKYFFIKSFDAWEFYRISNQTDEEFFNSLPEGQYYQYLKEEYFHAKAIMINKFDMKPSEVKKILDSIYGIKTKKIKK